MAPIPGDPRAEGLRQRAGVTQQHALDP
eukprot:COSAG06_NODE_41413_length_391_cov_1.756849_1_plen_27_part_10